MEESPSQSNANQEPADANQEPADDLRNAIGSVSQDVSELQEKLNRLRKFEKLLNELAQFRDEGWPLHIRAVCEKEKELLRSFREEGHPAIPLIEVLYRESDAKVGSLIQKMPGDLEKAAKKEGVPLDFSKSRHPKYFLGEEGFIEVQVADKKQTARVATREGNLATMPADAGAIIQKIKEENERLFGRKFNGKRFLGDLRSAYLFAIKSRKVKDGDPVPIREVFNSLSGRTKPYKGYKKDEFLVDLSRLVQKGPATTEGVRFELQQTKDTAEGMLLLGAAGRGMVNLLIFRKPEKTS